MGSEMCIRDRYRCSASYCAAASEIASQLTSFVLSVANIYDSLNIKINGGNENDNSTMLMALGTIKFSLETSLHLSRSPRA